MVREKSIAQRPPKDMPLTKEEMAIIRELDYEFPADLPKTAMGNLLPMEFPTPPPPKSVGPRNPPVPPAGRYDVHKKKLSGVLKAWADVFHMTPNQLLALRVGYVGATLFYPIFFIIAYIVTSIIMDHDQT